MKQEFLAAIAAATALACAVATHAAAPPVKTQAPGFHRMTLGDFEITTILDGTLELDVKQILTNVKPERVDELLARAFLKSPVETSVNTFLINTGTRLVLVDTGAASLFGPGGGRFLANLKAAGYTPEQIDDVVITHMHGDHIGGVLVDGQRTFANAVLHMDKHEVDYLTENIPKSSGDRKTSLERTVSLFEPYRAAKKFHAFEAGETIVPGVGSINAHGHTPGHTLYVAESKGQKLVLWGDLLHVAAVQFPEPAITITYDTDSNAAQAQRAKALQEAASEGYWVGIAHVPFPGIGHIRAEGAGFVWVPLNYSANR